MGNLVKKAVYLCAGLLAVVSAFLGFSVLSAKALADNPVANGTAATYNAVFEQNGAGKVTFFEFIGDFADKSSIEWKFTTIVAAVLLLVAVICAGMMLIGAIIAFIKKDEDVLNVMSIKWVAVTAFASCALSLLIMLIFPDLPKVPEVLSSVIEIKGAIGIGAVLFLVATGLAAVYSFIHSFLFKDEKK